MTMTWITNNLIKGCWINDIVVVGVDHRFLDWLWPCGGHEYWWQWIVASSWWWSWFGMMFILYSRI